MKRATLSPRRMSRTSIHSTVPAPAREGTAGGHRGRGGGAARAGPPPAAGVRRAGRALGASRRVAALTPRISTLRGLARKRRALVLRSLRGSVAPAAPCLCAPACEVAHNHFTFSRCLRRGGEIPAWAGARRRCEGAASSRAGSGARPPRPDAVPASTVAGPEKEGRTTSHERGSHSPMRREILADHTISY